MAAVPTTKVTKGEQTIIINESDLPEWQAKGWSPAAADAEKEAPKGKKGK